MDGPDRGALQRPASEVSGLLALALLLSPGFEVGEAMRHRARELSRPPPQLPLFETEEIGTLLVVSGPELELDWADARSVEGALSQISEAAHAQGGAPHFLVVLTEFPAPIGPFYAPLANDVRGIGYQHNFFSETFATAGDLQGVVFMGHHRDYAGQGADLGRYTFLHEVAHRWGAYVHFEGPEGDSDALLGRDCGHWSFLASTANSALEGNRWRALGGGRFRSETTWDFGYHPLDLYLMGLAPPESVPPIERIDTGESWPCALAARGVEPNPRWRAPTILEGEVAEVEGRLEAIGVEQILSAEGAREPDHRAARKVWRVRFVLAALDPPEEAALVAVEALAEGWVGAFEAAARLPGRVGARLVREASVGLPLPGRAGLTERCWSDEDCAAELTCMRTGLGPRVCSRACGAGCELGACCVSGWCAPAAGLACEAGPIGAEPIWAEPVGAEPVGAEPVGAEPVGAEPVGAEPPAVGSGDCACRSGAPPSPGWPLLLLVFSLRRGPRCARGSRPAC